MLLAETAMEAVGEHGTAEDATHQTTPSLLFIVAADASWMVLLIPVCCCAFANCGSPYYNRQRRCWSDWQILPLFFMVC